MCHSSLHSSPSLADELGAATSTAGRPHLVLRKCHPRLRHEDSSPDSERMTTDSGHSTAHSPDNGPKSVSPIPCSTLQNTNSVSPSSTPGDNRVSPRQGFERVEEIARIISDPQVAAASPSRSSNCSRRRTEVCTSSYRGTTTRSTSRSETRFTCRRRPTICGAKVRKRPAAADNRRANKNFPLRV